MQLVVQSVVDLLDQYLLWITDNAPLSSGKKAIYAFDMSPYLQTSPYYIRFAAIYIGLSVIIT